MKDFFKFIKNKFNFFLKKARQEWAETLWRDLDINILVDGVDNFIKSIKKMPRDVRAMTVAKTLENKLKSFKEALPLMTDLKHEALRERYLFTKYFN